MHSLRRVRLERLEWSSTSMRVATGLKRLLMQDSWTSQIGRIWLCKWITFLDNYLREKHLLAIERLTSHSRYVL